MFNFFCNLALAIYNGYWLSVDNTTLVSNFISYFKVVPIFGMFNNSTEAFYNTAGNYTVWFVDRNIPIPGLANFIAVILSTICCIGVFWMIIGAIRKIFSCFLEWF